MGRDLTITAVVVTYGRRWLYLKQVLEHLEETVEVAQVVVVDNASHYDVEGKCKKFSYIKVQVFRNEKNSGSAGGFSRGIAIAQSMNSEFILFLDDDVVPNPGAVSSLLDTYKKVLATDPNCLQVVTAYRFSQYGKLLVPVKHCLYEDAAAFGLNLFNFIDRHFVAPRKGLKKVRELSRELPRFGTAYAGLLVSRKVVEAIGLPNPDFVLYQDDIEYTYRIINRGGAIWLDIESEFRDVCDNVSHGIVKKPFLGYLFNEPDFKIYYIVRNQIYTEKYCFGKNSFKYHVNFLAFFFVLFSLCIALGRFKRISVLWLALMDGVRGRLGINSRFMLE